jgi:hypothetical protein
MITIITTQPGEILKELIITPLILANKGLLVR